MCGITGLISPKASSYIQQMTDAIAHRGPDDEGIYIDGDIALGHRRLSILDLSAHGHQPMLSEDGRYILVFNGEIYNHWEIREKIKDKYQFKSTSDTETILYGFAEFGIELFNMLNGIFAFSIYDKQNKEITIVRDQFGVKPLYYYQEGNDFLFSSEIKSLIIFPDFDKTLDNNTIANYLYFLWSPGENTPFNYCKKLLPGHYLTVNTDDVKSYSVHKYYEIPFTGSYSNRSEEELIDDLDRILTKAVERQLLSDVPVGFFLSGGLDSSIIVAIAKKLLPDKKLKCYTIETTLDTKREGFSQDLPYAKKVASYLDVDLEIVKAEIDIVQDFDKMIYHLDEPQADAAPLNVSNICKKAREQGYIVLVGGTAGDDLFSGYRRHQSLYYYSKLKAFPSTIKRNIFRISNLFPEGRVNRRIKKFFSIYNTKDNSLQSASIYGWLDEDLVRKLFLNELSSFTPKEFLLVSLKNIPGETSPLNQMLFWDLKFFLTDHNLNYTDKMSMMHGVEVRVPFLDKELVEFSTSIPPQLKMKGTTTKYILKKVAERYLPHEVIYRSKTGFGAPVRDWIINSLNEKIDSKLNIEQLNLMGLFNPKEVNKLIQDNKEGEIDASYSIWALLAIVSWLSQFV